MVQEQRDAYPSLWSAVELLASMFGCVSQTLHDWVEPPQIDAGECVGVASEGVEMLKAL